MGFRIAVAAEFLVVSIVLRAALSALGFDRYCLFVAGDIVDGNGV